jgi:hypothetical protein
MVDTDPDKRPTSMSDIRKALESIQTQAKQGITPLPPTQYAPPPPPQAYSYPPPQPLSYGPSPAQKQQQAYYVPSRQKPAKPALPKGKVWKTLVIGVVTGGLFYLLTFSFDVGLISYIGVGIILFLIAGLITGRVVVLRRTGFFIGCIGGVTLPIIDVIRYPYGISLSILILLLAFALVGGLIGLFGAWLATIGHPYYKKP